MESHVVTFKDEAALGLDRYDPSKAIYCPARCVLLHLEKPRGNPEDFATENALANFERAVKFLKELGEYVVVVSPFGVVVGEFLVAPYLITMKDARFLSEFRDDG